MKIHNGNGSVIMFGKFGINQYTINRHYLDRPPFDRRSTIVSYTYGNRTTDDKEKGEEDVAKERISTTFQQR